MKIDSNYTISLQKVNYQNSNQKQKTAHSYLSKEYSTLPRGFYYNHPLINFKGTAAETLLRNSVHNYYSPDTLNKIADLKGQAAEEFISQYCNHTGFPDLCKINTIMRVHSRQAIEKSEYLSGAKVLYAAFHKNSSAAKGLALPGDDLEAMGMIVDGSKEEIEHFKGYLWNYFDPTIVSIRKDFKFPNVYSLDEVWQWAKLTDRLVENSEMKNKGEKYTANLEEKDDYLTALEFNIDLAKEIDKYSNEELAELAPALSEYISNGKTPKTITLSMSSLLESFKKGEPLAINADLTPEQTEKFKSITKSALYKYGNATLQNVQCDPKEKLLLRKQFINEENFNELAVEEQLKLVSKMLYESFPNRSQEKIKRSIGENYSELFTNDKKANALRETAIDKAGGR